MRPRKPTPAELELQRKIHTLQVTLLRTNAELRTKVIYAERLEIALHQRCERIDQLERAHSVNRRLEAECEHLAQLVASPDNARLIARAS